MEIENPMGLRMADAERLADGPPENGACNDVRGPVLVLDYSGNSHQSGNPIGDGGDWLVVAIGENGGNGEGLGGVGRRERVASELKLERAASLRGP